MMERLKQDWKDFKDFAREHAGLVRLVILAVTVLACASCCLGTALGVAMSEGDGAEQTAVETSAPPLEATEETEPTGTPPPTNTPIPTNSPAPTKTPAPTPTESAMSEEEYISKAYLIMSDYVEALTAVSKVSSRAADDPYLMFDGGWESEMMSSLDLIRGCNRRVRSLDPPPAFEATHAHMLDAADHMDLSVDYIERGINEHDPSLLEEAAREMTLSTEDIKKATEAMP